MQTTGRSAENERQYNNFQTLIVGVQPPFRFVDFSPDVR